MLRKLPQKIANLYNEEDFLREFIVVFNKTASNKVKFYESRNPPEPDFLLAFEDDTKTYVEITQIYSFQSDLSPHNHRLMDFCAEVQKQLNESLPRTYGKIVVTISAEFNRLPSPRTKDWGMLLNRTKQEIIGRSTDVQLFYRGDSMPSGLEVFNLIFTHYYPNSLRSILVVPNTYEAYWEKERIGSLHLRIDDKNGKKYELKDASRVWLLIRDREGFRTIANEIETNNTTVVSKRFERIFLQEEYDPQSQSYPYIELQISD